MKIAFIKLFVIICCGSYDNGNYQYETRALDDTILYSVYSTVKYNVGDTIQYKIVSLSE
jgi:hypothetical protein